MPDSIDLRVHYRARGYRLPIHPSDRVEVWANHQRIAEVPGQLLLALVLHHVSLADLTARLARALEVGEPPPIAYFIRLDGPPADELPPPTLPGSHPAYGARRRSLARAPARAVRGIPFNADDRAALRARRRQR
jgi:hypothetical protein